MDGANYAVGDTITFGNYEQDNDLSNGKEPIEWIVLKKEDGKMLVISKYALDRRLYNMNPLPTTWAECSLRKWLNQQFLNDAFTKEEQKHIRNMHVSPDKNPRPPAVEKTNPGKVTNDKIFCLSIPEVLSYVTGRNAAICKATQYAISQGGNSPRNDCYWWTRTPGNTQNTVAMVCPDGKIYYSGFNATTRYSFVRPAMWIDLNF